MAQVDAKFVPLQDKKGPVFMGGIIDNAEPWMIPYKNTPYARNFRVNGQGISIRNGFTQFGESLGGVGDYPKGIGAYYRSNTANDRIVVRYNYSSTEKLVTINPTTGAQTPITTSADIGSDNRMQFLNAGDSVYCMNGSDNLGKLTGSTYGEVTTGLGHACKVKFGVFFDNSAFFSGDPNYPNELYKSVPNDPDNLGGSGSDLFTASYPINGLASTSETLYVFTENSIDMINHNSIKQIGSVLVYTSLPLEVNEGAMNNKTIAVFGRSVYYLTRSNKIKKIGVGETVEYDIVELSHRKNRGIDKTMASLNPDQSNGFVYVIPEQNIIKWHLKTKGANFNDICIIYNTEYDEFMVDTHKVFFDGINFKTFNYTISQIEDKVYLDEYGITDDDSPIQFRYDTKALAFGTPTTLKTLWQLRTYLGINILGEVTQNIYADGGLVDSKIIDSTTIPQASAGMGTQAMGTYAIGTEGPTIKQDELYNTIIVRDKGYLRVKAKLFIVSYVASKLGTRCLLQTLEPQVEQLHWLQTSHF